VLYGWSVREQPIAFSKSDGVAALLNADRIASPSLQRGRWLQTARRRYVHGADDHGFMTTAALAGGSAETPTDTIEHQSGSPVRSRRLQGGTGHAPFLCSRLEFAAMSDVIEPRGGR